MAASTVIGRDAELAVIEDFLSSVAHGPGALLLSGEPGIGKTILWEASVDGAAARGYRVLTHRSVETEAGLAFVGLSDLLGSVLDEVADLLAAPRRRALDIALLLADAGDVPPDPRAIGLASLDVLHALAERGPVVLALDDTQWLDASTARVLLIALRRVCDERIGVIATLRQAPGAGTAIALEECVAPERLQHVRLGPIELASLHRLLSDRLHLEFSRPDLSRIFEESRGNPFFALELARTTGRTRPGETTPVPDSLRGLLEHRLGQLSPATMDVLFYAAALTRPTVELVAASRGQADESVDALHDAARHGVVVLDESHVRFAHPLLASLCYEAAPPSRRRAAHRRLAESVTDPEARARHLALAAEHADASVAVELDAAAGHAAARGATAAAAELAELAATHTPPARTDDQHRRRFVAAGLHRLSGDSERACDIYEDLVDTLPGGVDRADVLYAVATTGRADIPARIRLCEQALTEASDDDARCAHILGYLAICRWMGGDTRAGLRAARGGLRRAERTGDPRVVAVALGRVGLMETWTLEVTPGLLEKAVAIERGLDAPLIFHDSPTFILFSRLQYTDEMERARTMVSEFVAAAIERGDEHSREWAVMQLVLLEWFAGRLRHALGYAAEAREMAEQTGEPQLRGMVLYTTSLVETDLGLLEQGQRSALEGLDAARSISDEIWTIANLAALGHAALVSGDMVTAVGMLRELPERQRRSGHPLQLGPAADPVEALIATGELAHARMELEQLEELAARTSRWARIGAGRARGMLAAADGDHARAFEAFERALREDERGAYPVERGRTLLALGAAQRRALHRRAARRSLEQALGIFEEIGASPWAAKARGEIKRISGRQRGSDELTEAEWRVAALAAEGRHNKEIAAVLFITVSTVEANLTRVYRKLGVRSRTELARWFASTAPK